LVALFPGHEVEATEPGDLAARVNETVCGDESVSFVGVAGGDGTVRCAVEALVQLGSNVPLLVIPAGTRNHFAGDLGITDLDAAATAATDGDVRSVDLGRVNDKIFVNNSSLGMYPNLVIEREEHERHLPKRLATAVAAWKQLRKGHRIAIDVDGVSCRVWAVFVGNNCYGETLLDLTGRDQLDQGVLDLRLARAKGKLSRLRIAGAVLFGRVAQSPLIERRTVSSVVIEASGRVDVAFDGEVMTMSPPLEYQSCPRGLRVLVPRETSTESG
jgi:undecaprenyl-diphosphatase